MYVRECGCACDIHGHDLNVKVRKLSGTSLLLAPFDSWGFKLRHQTRGHALLLAGPSLQLDFYFNVYECFICMYVCAPRTCLSLIEISRCQMPWNLS